MRAAPLRAALAAAAVAAAAAIAPNVGAGAGTGPDVGTGPDAGAAGIAGAGAGTGPDVGTGPGAGAAGIAGAAAASPFARFAFSWATPPVQAFPGAASRMMTDAEVTGFTNNFSSMMIWGLNTTCLDPRDNVTTFPAYCASSWCQCFPDRGAPLEQQRFRADMDAALQAQGAALKAKAAALGLSPRPTLGYIDFTSPQQTFFAQNQLRGPGAGRPALLAREPGDRPD